jgi:hypothetical protein
MRPLASPRRGGTGDIVLTARLWYLPDADHTKELTSDPRAFAPRVTSFLGRALDTQGT